MLLSLKLLQDSAEILQRFRWRKKKKKPERIKKNNRLLKRRPQRASLKITVAGRRQRLGVTRKYFHVTDPLEVRRYYVWYALAEYLKDDKGTLPAPRRSQTSPNASPPTTTNNERNSRTQVQEPARLASHPSATTANKKRKSESQIAVRVAGDDKQIAPSKKTNTISDSNAPVKQPIPCPIPRQSTSTKVGEILVYGAADKSEISMTPIRRASKRGDIPEQFHGAKRLRRTGISIPD